MAEKDNIPEMRPTFDAIRRTDENNKEYWSSRDLCNAMGYSTNWKFQNVHLISKWLCYDNPYIISPAIAICFFYQHLNSFHYVSGTFDNIEHVFILYHITEAICTHQYHITLFQTIFINVRFHIFFYTNCPCNDVLIRMVSCFFCFDSTKSYHLFYQRVIFGKLTDLIVDQVKSTVSHIGKVQCIANNSCRYQCRSHTFQFYIS